MVFGFGKNWQDFLKTINGESIKNAESSIVKFLELRNLKGRTFIDIGCGSGLFSYAAFRLGASKIVSFDSDPLSIECCKALRLKSVNPTGWEVIKGSILDNDFISKLGHFDIVYACGVLHHTGHMWQAMKNAANIAGHDSYFYLMIYNKIPGRIRGSEFWLKIKRLYNSSPPAGKYLIQGAYIFYYFVSNLMKLTNPLANIKNYKSNRGMDWKVDMIDWLGGYPYEFATVEEVFAFMKTNFPSFRLVNIKTVHNLGANSYLFKNEG